VFCSVRIAQVYSKNTIAELFGPKEVDRIQARHTGGVSGQKGTRFEDFFAVFKLVEELSFCYRNGSTRYKNVRRAIVRAQVFAMIDDVAVEVRKPRIAEHYQLKNARQVSWGSGRNSLAEAFLQQKRLCNKVKVKSRLYLVVPNQALRTRLQNSASSGLSKCATVAVFPFGSIPLLVQMHKPLRKALIKLSPFRKASVENDKLLSLAKFVCGHWFAANNKLSINDLAMAMEKEAGAFCRPMKGTRPMPSDIDKLLSRIPRFKWKLHKGFLFWSYGKTDSGRYPHHCWTREFDRLLARIQQHRPDSFEAIEGDLR